VVYRSPGENAPPRQARGATERRALEDCVMGLRVFAGLMRI